MQSKPSTFSELLANWSTSDLSADLGVPYVNARKMKERGSVAPEHWQTLITTAKRRGFRLTPDDLVAMRQRNRVSA